MRLRYWSLAEQGGRYESDLFAGDLRARVANAVEHVRAKRLARGWMGVMSVVRVVARDSGIEATRNGS